MQPIVGGAVVGANVVGDFVVDGDGVVGADVVGEGDVGVGVVGADVVDVLGLLTQPRPFFHKQSALHHQFVVAVLHLEHVAAL